MKILITRLLCIALLLCCLSSISQAQPVPIQEPDYKKPKLFADLPAKMNLKVYRLENFLSLPVGTNVSTFITDNFLFEGKIVSKADESTHKSVVIKSLNRPGATLTFTKTFGSNGTIKYIGRIMSFSNGDAFEIKVENGIYILQKTELYELMNE